MKIHLRSCEIETTDISTKVVRFEPRGNVNDLPHDFEMLPDEFICHEEEYTSNEYSSAAHPGNDSLVQVSTHQDSEKTDYFSKSTERNMNSLLKVRLGRIGRKCSQKDVSDIFKILAHPSVELGTFLSTCSGYKACMLEENEM